MYSTDSPPLSDVYSEHDIGTPERTSAKRVHRLKPSAFGPSRGFKTAPVTGRKPSIPRHRTRAIGRFLIAALIGVGTTLAWQSYGGEMVGAWAPSLRWLVPASTSAELQAQVKPLGVDLAIMRRSLEQLASTQDQLTRKQDQMAQAFATLQTAVRDIDQNILALAPLAPKSAHAR